MKRKDLFLAVLLSVPGIGLGHIYAGEKSKGFIIMAVQVLLLALAGVGMVFSSIIPTILYLVYFGILGWAMYDTITLVKLINEHVK